MTLQGLIQEIGKKEPYFFSKNTLNFFGETISKMRLLKTRADITDSCGAVHKQCYIISSLRRGLYGEVSRVHYYFDSHTFSRII